MQNIIYQNLFVCEKPRIKKIAGKQKYLGYLITCLPTSTITKNQLNDPTVTLNKL